MRAGVCQQRSNSLIRFSSCHHPILPRTCAFLVTLLLPRCQWTQTRLPCQPGPWACPPRAAAPSRATAVAPDTPSRKPPLDLCPQTHHLIRITLTLAPVSTKAQMTYPGFYLLNNLAATSTCVGRVCVLPDFWVSSSITWMAQSRYFRNVRGVNDWISESSNRRHFFHSLSMVTYQLCYVLLRKWCFF